MPRRIKLDRDAQPASSLTPHQRLEIRRMIEIHTSHIENALQRQEEEIVTQNLHIHNLSTIVRDMSSAVIMAKYSSGSVRDTLAELVQQLENALSNADLLMQTGDYRAGANLNAYTPEPIVRAGHANMPSGQGVLSDICVQEDATDIPDDPVSRLSDL